jgi:hypothetical protein
MWIAATRQDGRGKAVARLSIACWRVGRKAKPCFYKSTIMQGIRPAPLQRDTSLWNPMLGTIRKANLRRDDLMTSRSIYKVTIYRFWGSRVSLFSQKRVKKRKYKNLEKFLKKLFLFQKKYVIIRRRGRREKIDKAKRRAGI